MTDARSRSDGSSAKKAVKGAAKKTRAAVDDTAGAVRDEADEAMDKARAARASVAENVDPLVSALRDADFGEFVTATTRFARQRPGAFLGSAALLGFAAARLAKASSGAQTPEAYPEHDTRARTARSGMAFGEVSR